MEGYPSNWKRVILAVSPTGLFHAIGGDRADGQCDTEYLGLTPLQKRIYALEEETGNLQCRNSKLVDALKGLLARHGDGSEEGPWAEWDTARAALKEVGE